MSSSQEGHVNWKKNVPILYDMLIHKPLAAPAYACEWGAVRSQGDEGTTQQLFFTRSTNGALDPATGDWSGLPNMLYSAEVLIPPARTEAASFVEQPRAAQLRVAKRIVHPGEVLNLVCVPQRPRLLLTHASQSHKVLGFDMSTQPDRAGAKEGTQPSKPDFVLEGHQDMGKDNFYFALACDKGSKEPLVLSGGSDTRVLMWSLEDAQSGLAKQGGSKATDSNANGMDVDEVAASSSSDSKAKDGSTATALQPRGQFVGHTDTVEDVAFQPNNSDVFCSVGDDLQLLLWDARSGRTPTHHIATNHQMDVNSVSWNPVHDHLVATGSSDATIKIFDLRKLGKSKNLEPDQMHEDVVARTIAAHLGNVIKVQWGPNGSHLASCSEDRALNVWDIGRMASPLVPVGKQSKSQSLFEYRDGLGGTKVTPRELTLRHAGHRGPVVNFQWNYQCPSGWVIASLSDESVYEGTGGLMQIWRPNHMLYRPCRTVLREMSHQLSR